MLGDAAGRAGLGLAMQTVVLAARAAGIAVFDGVFKDQVADQAGYLETFETVIDQSKIQFTPQKKFFDTTQNWASALQDIYGGDDARSRLDGLAKTNTSKVNL